MGEDEAVARLQAILARPEFQTTQSPSIWDQLAAAVWDTLVGLVSPLVQVAEDSLSGRTGWVGLAVLLACLALLVGGVGYLVRSVRLAMSRETRVHARGLAERRDRSDGLWRQAEQCAEAGDLEAAARLVYLSALYALDERSLLHVEASQTNREHAGRLRAEHPRLGDVFADLVQRYDRVRYGRFEVSGPTFDELRRLGAAAREAALGRAA